MRKAAAVRKPVASEGDKRPALMALLGVWSWINLPRAVLEQIKAHGRTMEERVRAVIIIHTLGHEFAGEPHSDVVDGRPMPYAVRWETGRLEEMHQADIVRELGLDDEEGRAGAVGVSRAIARLREDGFIRLEGRRIYLVPEPSPGDRKPEFVTCTVTNSNLDPEISMTYEERLAAIEAWFREEHARFLAELRKERQAKVEALRIELGIAHLFPKKQPRRDCQHAPAPPEDGASCGEVPEPSPGDGKPEFVTCTVTNSNLDPEISITYEERLAAIEDAPETPPESPPPPPVETLDGFDDALTSAFESHGKPLPTRQQVERAFAALPPGSREAYLNDLTSPANGQRARIDRMAHPGALKQDVPEFVRRRWPRLKAQLDEARRKQAEWEARQAEEEARLAAEIAARPPNEREEWEEEFLRDYRSRHRHGPPKARSVGGAT